MSSNSSSDINPGGLVETQVSVYADGTIGTTVLHSSGDDGGDDFWSNGTSNDAKPYIPPNARLKIKGECDSTSSSSPDERQKAARKKKSCPGTSKQSSELDANQNHSDNVGPSQQANGSPRPQIAVSQVSQPETRETHRSHFAPSGNVTPPEEDHKTALVNRGVVVQGSESGLADSHSSSTGIGSSGDTSSDGSSRDSDTSARDEQPDPFLEVLKSSSSDVDVGCHSNQPQQSSFHSNSIIDGASNDNLLASSEVVAVDKPDIAGVAVPSNNASSGAHGGGGASNAGFSDVDLKKAEKVPETAGYVVSSCEENLPSYQLADGVSFEANIVVAVAEGLDTWTYLIFLKHLGLTPTDDGTNVSSVSAYILQSLLQWWKHQDNPTIEPILYALKKSGNGRLRDKVIKQFCKLE
ncbi:uncharacterized protein [Amphiura filiformis]|uniref:uncharacterized protein n=1 Tax=Amphiura filiformis TaxID=82378 RepID=UPI003B21EFB1